MSGFDLLITCCADGTVDCWQLDVRTSLAKLKLFKSGGMNSVDSGYLLIEMNIVLSGQKHNASATFACALVLDDRLNRTIIASAGSDARLVLWRVDSIDTDNDTANIDEVISFGTNFALCADFLSLSSTIIDNQCLSSYRVFTNQIDLF